MATTLDQFKRYESEGYNWIPVIDEMIGDLDTPLRLYLKLGANPYSYLLESGGHHHPQGRYSFIGLSLHAYVKVKKKQITHVRDGRTNQHTTPNPLAYIENIIAEYKAPEILPDLPFTGGWVGYFGYNTIRYIEPRLAEFPTNDPVNIPDIYLLLCDTLLVYDNISHKIHLIVYADPQQKDGYQNALAKLQQIKASLKLNEACASISSRDQNLASFASNISAKDFENKVVQAKDYFMSGDAMQLILSQRFSKTFSAKPLQFYRALRHLNPSPYMFYFNMDDFHIAGASPEILVRLQNNKIVVRPLAGTRKRGCDSTEDQELERELLADTKEIAEHLMLIDLGRNDVGRVATVGTVNVTEQMKIERFSHVMHISSTVEADLAKQYSVMDLLKATFPAGTVSGAPKIRAMEIIDELETDDRGLYGGAIGYIGFNGNMDLALALRTAIIKGNQIHIQTGAGLVADSIPANEWQECYNKANALFAAVQYLENNDDADNV